MAKKSAKDSGAKPQEPAVRRDILPIPDVASRRADDV